MKGFSAVQQASTRCSPRVSIGAKLLLGEGWLQKLCDRLIRKRRDDKFLHVTTALSLDFLKWLLLWRTLLPGSNEVSYTQ